jgi:hypothetical protein
MNGIGDTRLLEERVLKGLKDFQRRTVDYAFRRMYESDKPTNRFLVADEAGLGKTLVARGLIARIINHLNQAGAERADILYICSNANIASQNIRRLNVTNKSEFALSTRITLLPRNLTQLKSNGLNFISFTPGTSFNMVSRTGVSEERAVIFRLLEYALDEDLTQSPGAFLTLRGNQVEKNFRSAVWSTHRVGGPDDANSLDSTLADAFKHELLENRHLLDRFWRYCDHHDEANTWWKRASLTLELRKALARSCISALKPDLVILDEFQRFRDLLQTPDVEDPNDIRQLSHQLFSRNDTRLLLLSATPYKMYTLHDETDDNHYEDFLRVARFLMGSEEEKQLRTDLDTFRGQLRRITSTDNRDLIHQKQHIEDRLRRFMSRTERLASSSDRNGMLAERQIEQTQLSANDLHDYRALDKLSRKLDAGDSTEYWKSSPYLINFMDNYKIKRELKRALAHPERSVNITPLLRNINQLPTESMKSYGYVDPGNARLRGLLANMVENGAWHLPWLPPSMPYYRGSGAWVKDGLKTITKRLIFSSWNVVPDAISMLLSYEAERNMMLSYEDSAVNTVEYRNRNSGRLALQRGNPQPTTMSTFSLLFPSAALAELADPFEIAGELGADYREISVGEVLGEATRRIRIALEPHVTNANDHPASDQRWYWAAPLLLDRSSEAANVTRSWLAESQIVHDPSHSQPDDIDDPGSWSDHVKVARQVIEDGIQLGQSPSDLAEVTALLALGGPGNCALRSLVRRLSQDEEPHQPQIMPEFRNGALRIAWGFRTLFNLPTITSLIRGSEEYTNLAYWQRVAATGVAGNLQAVLDEYIHVLPEWLGLVGKDRSRAVTQIGNAVHETVAIRAVNYRAEQIGFNDESFELSPNNIRVRFAMRFGTNVSEDQKKVVHAGAVRSAFNSPFWPFVLATTSVGQEGLDFHQYCHAVVHWNLPSNPVDLEQREGRVHRYKGHAIRKNVAERHRAVAFQTTSGDPWAEMLDEAAQNATSDELRDISPYWVYDGSARIERYVPHLPLSKEVGQLQQLKRSVAAYRMVIGQPRQEDLLSYLRGRVSEDELETLMQDLRIDLTPRYPSQ